MQITDSEEAVVARVLSSLTSLAELGLFTRMRVWELMSATLAFLYHPNIWIREGIYIVVEKMRFTDQSGFEGSVAFIVSATKHLPPTDTWAILYPSLKFYLRAEIGHITEEQLFFTLKPHVNAQLNFTSEI
jgi:phosphoinositide-3-kinase regulatory subunit 4